MKTKRRKCKKKNYFFFWKGTNNEHYICKLGNHIKKVPKLEIKEKKVLAVEIYVAVDYYHKGSFIKGEVMNPVKEKKIKKIVLKSKSYLAFSAKNFIATIYSDDEQILEETKGISSKYLLTEYHSNPDVPRLYSLKTHIENIGIVTVNS